MNIEKKVNAWLTAGDVRHAVRDFVRARVECQGFRPDISSPTGLDGLSEAKHCVCVTLEEIEQ